MRCAVSCGQRGVGLLALLHHLEQLVLEARLPPGQRGDLVLQALELLGRQAAGLHPLLVARGAGAHGVDVVLEPALLGGDVVGAGLGVDDVVRRAPAARCSRSAERGELGQRAAPVRELGERGVDRLQVEQAQLGGVIGVH